MHPFMFLFFLFIGVPIIFMINSSIKKKNILIRQRVEKQIKDKLQHDIEVKAERDKRIEAARLIESEIDKKLSIMSKLKKNYKLFETGIYFEQEYLEHKVSIIQDVKSLSCNDAEEFLLELLPLKEAGVIDQSDLMKIKSYLIKAALLFLAVVHQ
jgi:hypothetical protein